MRIELRKLALVAWVVREFDALRRVDQRWTERSQLARSPPSSRPLNMSWSLDLRRPDPSKDPEAWYLFSTEEHS